MNSKLKSYNHPITIQLDRISKIVKQINTLGLMPARLNINNIDFLDKFVVDIIHATVSSNDDFFINEYPGLTKQFLVEAGMGDAVFDPRNYTTTLIRGLCLIKRS